jgi:site-specific recombinase XerD
MNNNNALEYLTESQIEDLMNACNKVFKRYAHRNKTMILMAYQHALRSSELCFLQWRDVDLQSNRLYVRRVKGSISTYQPMSVRLTKSLHKVKKDFAKYNSNYVFISQRGFPIDNRTFRQIMQKLGEKLNMENIHPHILRHSCGYHLANQGLDTRLIQDYLGHSNINNTVIYTKTNPERFNNIKWRS